MFLNSLVSYEEKVQLPQTDFDAVQFEKYCDDILYKKHLIDHTSQCKRPEKP
jgi:pimeloyl-CoA synthetase